jgi:hypothetical protein
MSRSNLRLILAAVLPTLLVVAATWPEGLTVRAASIVTGGPVTLMGIDAEEQAGVGSHPVPGDYTRLINTMLSEVSAGRSGILVVGAGKPELECANSPDYSKVFWDAVDTNITTDTIRYVNGQGNIFETLTADYLSGFKMLAVASSDFEIASGCGLTDAENDALVAKKEVIKEFVNEGGALLGFTATGLTQPYGYISSLGTFSFRIGQLYDNITPTAEGSALGITDDAFDKCCWHDTFTAFPSFLKVLATSATSETVPNPFPGEAAAIGGRQVVIELCNEDGSPNGTDEDGDGVKDEGCYRERSLNFTPNAPSATATFTDLGTVRDNSFTLTHQFGVLQPFSATVRATIEHPADITFSPDRFGARTTCSSNKLELDLSTEPCVRYEILTDAVPGLHYGEGDRAVQLKIAFFQPAAQKDPLAFDPVMGFTHDCGTFNQSILDHAIFPPGEDPEGVGYVDTYGSCAIMGVTPRPEQPAETDACHVDGTPNGIDEDRDGVIDDGCEVTKTVACTPEQPACGAVFNDVGNVKPSSLQVDHKNGVTAPFDLTMVAKIVNPADLAFVVPGFPGPGRTVCASNLVRPGTADPDDPLPCVQYELVGPDGDPYNPGDPGVDDDGVEITIRYFAPELQASTHVAGMGYSDTCNTVFDRNILFSFTRFPGDSDPNDPEGVGYVDTYGSCVVMTATEPPAPVLNLPDDITVVATSAAGAQVSYVATATGVIDGVLSTIPAACSPASGSTFPIGHTTVHCTGGSKFPTLAGSFNVNVVYRICALYDTTTPKKAGSTIPIKLNLCDASGNNLSSEAIALHATSLTYLSGTVTGEPEDPGSSQPDNNFRFTSPSYHFNLQTTGLASGSWTLNFTVGGDPTVYSTPFAIK